MTKYTRFGAIIATSTLVMFGLMYLNTYEFSHVWFSQTRAHMALAMSASMAVVMLAFMLHMYDQRKVNMGILAVVWQPARGPRQAGLMCRCWALLAQHQIRCAATCQHSCAVTHSGHREPDRTEGWPPRPPTVRIRQRRSR